MGSKVDFDEILKYIGQLGPWQLRIHFLMWLTSAASGLAVVVYTFTAFAVDYRCLNPYCEEDKESASFFNYNSTYDLNSCAYLGVEQPVQCEKYLERITKNQSIIDLHCSHEALIFDQSVVTSSLMQDFGFTCESAYLKSIYGSLYMLGMLFGSFIVGAISDRYGRIKALMLSIALLSGSGFLGAFMPNAHGFGFFRFITGIGGIGVFMTTFVITVETVGVKYTTLVGIAIEIPFALGELILGLEAYFIRDWFTLQLVAYTPIVVLLGLYFIVPESPRWLIATERFDEAEKVIKSAALTNNKEVPESLFKPTKDESQDPSSEVAKPTMVDLFRPRSILLRSINMFYQWFSVTICYYGLSFASVDLLGDPYTNFSLSVAVEIPAHIFCILFMDCWGRRPILSFTQLVSGLSCIGAGLLYLAPESLAGLQVFLSLIGKFGATASFAIVYVYTAELFPTVIRNTAIGACSTIARVGGICAILIGLTKQFSVVIPMVVMGIVAVIAGIFAVRFPETVGNELPETMEDAINIGKNSNRGLCTCICPKNMGEIFKE